MNKPLTLLTTAFVLAGVSSAFAASSTDLTVTGIITPVACTPSLPNGGVVDYGKISVRDLFPTGHTPLQNRTIQLTVNCDASAQFAIRTIDNRPDTSSYPNRFGLGLINGSQKLGNYALGFQNPVADTAVNSLASSDNGQTWRQLTGISVAPPNDWVAFGDQAAGVWTPGFLQNVTVDVALFTYINAANELDLTNEVSLDGSATLQIEYL